MTRRRWWLAGAGAAIMLVVVVLAIVAALRLWPSSSESADPGSTAAPTATPSSSAGVRELAQAELDDHLEQCTALGMPGGSAPPGCGIRIPWGTEFAAVDDAAFRIEQLPRLELDADGQGFVAAGGVLVATVSGRGQDGAPRTETYRSESWTVRGDVDVRGDAVTLDVW